MDVSLKVVLIQVVRIFGKNIVIILAGPTMLLMNPKHRHCNGNDSDPVLDGLSLAAKVVFHPMISDKVV